jgi:hypothetical protein
MQMPTLSGMTKAWFALAVIALVLLAVVSRYDYSMIQGARRIEHNAHDRWTGAVWSLLPTDEEYEGNKKLIWFKISERTIGSVKREIKQRTDSLDQIIERRKREEE